MDLTGFFELGKDGGSLRGVARALEVWLENQGVKASRSVCTRAIVMLVERGAIVTQKGRTRGLPDLLKPKVISV